MSSVVTAPDGTRLAYQRRGQGAALVLLAGQANNHHWWDDVRRDFDRHTITVDYRGTGDSDDPDQDYSTQLFADDVIAVLDHAGIDRADVYGTSMGGRVAQMIAIRHPQRVRRLILGCTSPGGRHSIERGDTVRRALAGPTSARRSLLEYMYTPHWLAHRPGGPFPVLGDPRMSPRARRNHLRASNNHDAWDQLPTIQVPTLILHGSDDLLNPAANAPLLHQRIPHSRVEIVQNARHAYFHEFRATASALVKDFLDEPGSERSEP